MEFFEESKRRMQKWETCCRYGMDIDYRDVYKRQSLYGAGVKNILLLEREKQLGGILRQCIHDGFGLMRFGASLSGPEYAWRFIEELERMKVPYRVNTSVTALSSDRIATVVSPDGVEQIKAKAIVLAMGCRERTRGALAIPGERPRCV